MGTTTFTGPVRSGPILNTSGNALGSNVANVGTAVLSQAFPLTETGTTTTTPIVLPAGATITNIWVYATVAYGAALTLNSVNTSGTSAALTGTVTPVLGINDFGPTTQAETQVWISAPTDIRITATSATAGAGVGVLVVNYVQN